MPQTGTFSLVHAGVGLGIHGDEGAGDGGGDGEADGGGDGEADGGGDGGRRVACAGHSASPCCVPGTPLGM